MLDLVGLMMASLCVGCVEPQQPLRLALVMENMGITTVSPRIKLLLNADSVIQLLDAQGSQAVPPVPPDSVPTSLINSLALLTDEIGKQQRSELVVLMFHPDASQASRQSAISRVGGVVVGGQRSYPPDGWYIVRVTSATTVAAIDLVLEALRADSSVAVVGPFSVGFPNEESWLRSSTEAPSVSATAPYPRDATVSNRPSRLRRPTRYPNL